MLNNENQQKDGINEGTKVKAILQLRAIEFLKSYPCSKTLDSFAKLLCWDLHTTYRTALESYIMPMYEHGYFVYEGKDKFTFHNGKAEKQIKKGKIDKKEKEETFMEHVKNNPNQAEKDLGENKK